MSAIAYYKVFDICDWLLVVMVEYYSEDHLNGRTRQLSMKSSSEWPRLRIWLCREKEFL